MSTYSKSLGFSGADTTVIINGKVSNEIASFRWVETKVVSITLVYNLFSRDVKSLLKKDNTITLLFANEDGVKLTKTFYGVKVKGEWCKISTDDVVVEVELNLTAKYVTPIERVNVS